MKWTKIKVHCRQNEIETVSAILSVVDPGLEIEDYSDIEENLMTVYGELIDDQILNSDRSKASVGIYLSEERSAEDALSFIRERLAQSGLSSCEIETTTVDEEDWANNWKQFYKPLRIGRHLLVLPPWETCQALPDDKVILMDPGMAFGTGTHETTRLCLELMEKHLRPGEKVLDVGTGSGILSIAAVKLGASRAFAYDVDHTAVRVANENFENNGVSDKAFCAVSDLLAGVDRANVPFSFAVANIVADILIRMAPDVSSYLAAGARLVVSGVIEGRREDVVSAVQKGGLRLIDEKKEADWTALVFIK